MQRQRRTTVAFCVETMPGEEISVNRDILDFMKSRDYIPRCQTVRNTIIADRKLF